MTKLYDENNHLSRAGLLALRDGALGGTELLGALDHLSGCPDCADRLACSIDHAHETEVPAGFAQELVGRIDALEHRTRPHPGFALRVALAAGIALVFLYSGILQSAVQTGSRASTPLKAPDFQVVNRVSGSLKDFSQNIVHWEGINFEKKKK